MAMDVSLLAGPGSGVDRAPDATVSEAAQPGGGDGDQPGVGCQEGVGVHAEGLHAVLVLGDVLGLEVVRHVGRLAEGGLAVEDDDIRPVLVGVEAEGDLVRALDVADLVVRLGEDQDLLAGPDEPDAVLNTTDRSTLSMGGAIVSSHRGSWSVFQIRTPTPRTSRIVRRSG